MCPGRVGSAVAGLGEAPEAVPEAATAVAASVAATVEVGKEAAQMAVVAPVENSEDEVMVVV